MSKRKGCAKKEGVYGLDVCINMREQGNEEKAKALDAETIPDQVRDRAQHDQLSDCSSKK